MLSDVPKVIAGELIFYLLVQIQKLGPNSYTEVLQFTKHLSTSYLIGFTLYAYELRFAIWLDFLQVY